MPLSEYFTGYRESVRAAGELITEVVVPLPAATTTAFHKIAKRPFDDISSVAVAFALDIEDGTVTKARIGLGGVAATPIRATATEQALEGKPWDDETVEAAARRAGRRGHADLRPAGQRGVPIRHARQRAAEAGGLDVVEHDAVRTAPRTPSSA